MCGSEAIDSDTAIVEIEAVEAEGVRPVTSVVRGLSNGNNTLCAYNVGSLKLYSREAIARAGELWQPATIWRSSSRSPSVQS